MPGHHGIVSTRPLDPARLAQARQAAARLRHVPWLQAGAWTSPDGRAWMGDLRLGVFDEAPAERAATRLLVHGEVVSRWSAERRVLTPAEVLDLYQQRGLDLLRDVEGSFTLAVYDGPRALLHLANDRYALRPCYVARGDGCLAWGPEAKFCLAFPFVSRALDAEAVTEYFRFQCILGDRTFFRDVQVLPYGSALTFDLGTGAVRLDRYWDYDQLPAPRTVSFARAVDESAERFDAAVRWQTSTRHRYGALLSGGLDSRLIAGVASRHAGPLDTFTYGHADSRDFVYAAQVARRLGARHHAEAWRSGHWMQELAEHHTALTESFHCLFHAHGLHIAPAMRERIDVNLSGLAGDLITGGSFLAHEPFPAGTPEPTVRDFAYRVFVDSLGKGFKTPQEEGALFADPALRAAVTGVEERFHAAFHQVFARSRPDIATDLFGLCYRVRRTIEYFLVFARPYFEDRATFYDNDFLDLMYAMPSAHRVHRHLQIALLDRLTPSLATVPWQKTDMLPTARHSPAVLWHGLRRRVEWRLQRLTHERFPRPLRFLFADYARWIQGDARPWIESVLLDPRTLDRGVFQPDLLRRLLADHAVDPARHTYQIGAILSFEIMLRQVAAADGALNPEP